MTAELVTDGVWTELLQAAKANRTPSWVAVAYFGQEADKLLRLAPGSRLVVNASVPAVKAGQTHPQSLLRLVRRGVRVYSVENLHAKVYQIGNRAFIGSANASHSSAQRLIEIIVSTSDRSIVKGVRKFVQDLCLEALSPEALTALQKSYRPPRFEPTASAHGSKRRKTRVKTSPLRVAQLYLGDWPDYEAEFQNRGLRVARSRREHRAGWEIQNFRFTGRCRVLRGDLLMQVVDEGSGRRLVEPPGKVLNVVRRRSRRGRVAYVYVEVPKITRRPRLLSVARNLGRGAKKELMRDGLLRDRAFAQRVLRYWASR